MQSDLFKAVLETFDKLGLWDDGVELIGSWSFLIYQRHMGVRPLPLRTLDIDFLLPRPYPHRSAVDLEAALTPLGFHRGFAGSGAVHYLHPELKLEFLTPERGKGQEERPRLIKPLGLRAIQLRFLDMLFEDSIVIKEGNVRLRVPNPLNYCLHKLIVAQRRRKKEKREKDMEQAVYVLAVLKPTDFKEALSKLPKKWKTYVNKSLGRAWDLFPLERPILERFFTPQK